MNKKAGFSAVFFLLFICLHLAGQGSVFGVKGGLTMGRQRWEQNFQNGMLFRYHGAAFIESLGSDSRFALFAQAGYHVKGSAIRFARGSFVDVNGQPVAVNPDPITFQFRNVALSVGAKQRLDNIDLGEKKVFYTVALRGDYTLSTELGPKGLAANDPFRLYYPQEEFVKRFNYGITASGGIEMPFNELAGMILEFSFSPDFSFQYNQPPLNNVINPNPFGGNTTVNLPQQRISNMVFELSLGFRFLHKIIYVE
jgi:hypothetical protein